VAVLKRRHDLAEVEDGFFFLERAIPVDKLEEVPLLDVLGDQIARETLERHKSREL
jgi:hypothetical protein